MMSQSPGMVMMLLSFLLFPIILSGNLKEKGATMVASFVGAIFAFPYVLFFYLMMVYLLY